MKIIKAAFWAALIVCDIKNTICFINFAQFDFSIILNYNISKTNRHKVIIVAIDFQNIRFFK